MKLSTRIGLAATAAMVVATLSMLGARQAYSVGPVDRVEEDWELVVLEPSVAELGPQVTTIMSPVANLEGTTFAFNINYRDQPSFRSGGLEVVHYEGKRAVASDPSNDELLATNGETIKWTQVLSVSAGTLIYDIDKGSSTTWGVFGKGQGKLHLSCASSVSDLSAYSPALSVENSGPGWQPNRVSHMKLLRVRYYSGGNLVSEDSTPREVTLMH